MYLELTASSSKLTYQFSSRVMSEWPSINIITYDKLLHCLLNETEITNRQYQSNICQGNVLRAFQEIRLAKNIKPKD